MKTTLCAAALSVGIGLTAIPALAGDTPAPQGASVYFVNIGDGARVNSPVKIVFGLSGMGVAPAGIEKDNTGHHHILIDRAAFGEGADDGEISSNGIPADDNHKHFGGGQTEVMLDLAPGEHTLQLLLADQFHVPHNPPVTSERITISVE